MHSNTVNYCAGETDLNRTRHSKFVGKPCPYCGRKMTSRGEYRCSIDHVYPKSKGGDLRVGNKLICCLKCNKDKANMTPREFLEHLEKIGDARASHVARVVKLFDLGAYFHESI